MINIEKNLTSGFQYLRILSKKLISFLHKNLFNFGFYFSTGSILLNTMDLYMSMYNYKLCLK